MATTFATVLTEARGLLNDPSGAVYPDTPMLGLGNKVYRELQTKLAANGVPVAHEVATSITVSVGTAKLIDGAGLPTDFLYPRELKERLSGSSELFIPMDSVDFIDPNLDAEEDLRVWSFREEEIQFVGATTIRQVWMRYTKSLGTVTATSSPILIIDAVTWLAQRLAAVAALVIGHNPTRAGALSDDLVQIWDDLRIVKLKPRQLQPVRRRRTRYRVP